MGMGIEQISNSSLLSQLEQMNRQMNAMAQGAATSLVTREGQNFNQPYFNGSQAVNAFHQQATESITNTLNPNGVDSNNNPATQQTASVGQTVGEFKQLLKDAFEDVNVLQNEAGSLQSRFDVGDRSVTLADVMIASQKSSLSFEATLQIRNKLVDAYQSIMQMQI